jgi:hypothetical protein
VSSKEGSDVTIGYKYYLGAHMGIVHGPVDVLSRVRVADKVVWEGCCVSDGIQIEAAGAFGGDSGEGGIEGWMYFENGYPDQPVNPYLQLQLTQETYSDLENIPAFRGVTCAVLEQMYVSAFNPYLKPWAFRMTRTDVTTYGEEQWYVAKARIPRTLVTPPVEDVDEDGVGIYGDLIPETDAVISGVSASVSLGNWRIATLTSGTFSTNKDCEVELLIVGGGGGSSDSGGGAGAGEVAIYRYALTAGTTYRATVGAAGAADTAGGDSFVRIDGFDQTHESAAVALGGHRTAPQDLRQTCAAGEGGDNKWGGSGASSPGCWFEDEGPSCVFSNCSIISGGQGFCTKGGDCPPTVVVGFSGDYEIWAQAGRAGGAGFCDNGRDGGQGQCSTGANEAGYCYPSGTWKGGDGGKGGNPFFVSFDGTSRAYAFGGGGRGGYTQASVSGGSFGANAESWKTLYGAAPGSGGDGFGATYSGGSGQIKMRWRVS